MMFAGSDLGLSGSRALKVGRETGLIPRGCTRGTLACRNRIEAIAYVGSIQVLPSKKHSGEMALPWPLIHKS